MSNSFSHCPPVHFRKVNSSFHYSTIDQIFDNDEENTNMMLRDSLQTALIDKIRDRLNDLTQLEKAQINSLKKTEQDLQDGHFKIESFIQNIQQQQIQAQVSLLLLLSSHLLIDRSISLELFNKSSN